MREDRGGERPLEVMLCWRILIGKEEQGDPELIGFRKCILEWGNCTCFKHLINKDIVSFPIDGVYFWLFNDLCYWTCSYVKFQFFYLLIYHIYNIQRCFEKGICLLQVLKHLIEDWLEENLKLGQAFKETVFSLNQLNLVSLFLRMISLVWV